MTVPQDPTGGWAPPDGSPPAVTPPAPPPQPTSPRWTTPVQAVPLRAVPPQGAAVQWEQPLYAAPPVKARGSARRTAIVVVSVVVVLGFCGGMAALAKSRFGELSARRPAPSYSVRTGPAYPGYPTGHATATGVPQSTGASHGPSAVDLGPEGWVLRTPGQAGTWVLLAHDPASEAELTRQRSTGVPRPYAAVYADPVDNQYRTLVTGRVGDELTAIGTAPAIDKWAERQHQQHPGWFAGNSDVDVDGKPILVPPVPLGGAGRCLRATFNGNSYYDGSDAVCAWAAMGVVVEFVFTGTPARVATDRVAAMIPALVARR